MPGNKANKSSKTGDKLFAAENNISIFSEDVGKSHFLGNRNISVNIPDMIRYFSGAFWTAPTQESSIAKAFYKDRFAGMYPVTSVKFQEINNRGVNVVLTCPTDDREKWSELLDEFLRNSSEAGTEFFDHATEYNIFEEGSNKEEQSHGLLNMYADISSDYNFLQREYEEKISDSTHEKVLPNFYNFLLRDHRDMGMKILLGHRGRLPVSDQVFSSDQEQDRKYTPVSSYYNAWARDLEQWRLDARYEELNDRMTRIEFTKNETDMMGELYKYKEVFPMFNTIDFTVDKDARFGTVLEDTKFMPYLKSYLTPSNSSNIITSGIRYTRSTNSGEIQPSEVYSNSTMTFYDADHFFENYRNQEGDILNSIYFSDMPITEENRTYYHLMSIICKGRIEKIKKEVVRTYQEIMEGRTAYNEVIFYEVKKFDQENNLLQTFHFTNTDELDMIRYVDTQVKYGRRYKYEISSINMVIGTSYSYSYDRDKNASSIRDGNFDFDVAIKPSVKLVRVPLFEKSVIMIDNPPIAPEVTIVPFAGVSDRIRILMDSGVGSYMLEPITFSRKDVSDVEKHKIAQDLPKESTKIKYETDDHTQRFMIYRMDTEPYSYSDFVESARLTTVSTVDTSLSVTKYTAASSAGFDDTIEPNKKYYYCFRSTDYHGHNSYPTEVFSVEMIEDTGSVYPIIRVHEFREPEEGQVKRGVKRFFSIKPAMRNLLVNDKESGIPESGPNIGQDIVFGRGADTVWKKKFKIRLTSKSTGRKVDFNFSFDYKNKNKEEA